MKKSNWFILAISLVLTIALVLPACASPAPAPSTPGAKTPAATAPAAAPIKLRVATAHPPNSLPVSMTKAWGEKVGKATNGRIVVEVYPGGELFSHTDAPNAVPSGAIEMFITEAGHWTGAIGEIMNYQQNLFLMPSAAFFLKGEKVYAEVMDKIWQKFNTKYLFVLYRGAVAVMNSKRSVKLPEDMKGLSLRGATPAGRDSVTALGGKGVSLAVDEVYDAVQKGTLDGAVTGTESVWTRGFWEVGKFSTTPFNIELWPIIINADAWKKIPPGDQQIMLQLGAEAQANSFAEFGRFDDDAIQNVRKKGAEFYVLSDAEIVKWMEAMKPQHDKYVQKSKDQGYGDLVIQMRRAFGDTRY
jgi:C4-dicarboxylate-binding protein DctP